MVFGTAGVPPAVRMNMTPHPQGQSAMKPLAL
jgi:hypothetical protein